MSSMRSSFRILTLATLAALASACSGSTDDGAPAPSVDEWTKAGRFTQMKRGPTDHDLHALDAAAAKLENGYLGTYRFEKAGPEATDPAAREKRVKEVMHRYMCSFFDDSIDLSRRSGANAAHAILDDLDMTNNASDQDAAVKAFSDALGPVLKNKNLDVLSGNASGNNTMGEVMGVYDVAHDEILYFGFTNCGSDD